MDSTTALQRRSDHSALPAALEHALHQASEDLACLVGSPAVRDRLLVVLWEQIRRSPQLQQCTPHSIVNSVLRMAKLHLDPSLPNECHLIPYDREARLILGYAGMRKLVLRHPAVVDVWCHVVHANDIYEERNIDEPPLHRRPPQFAPRGAPIGYYAVARLATGGARVVAMSVDEVRAYRQRYSRAAKNQIWDGHFDAMALKTTLRQLCHARELPMDAEIQQVFQDEEALSGVTPARWTAPAGLVEQTEAPPPVQDGDERQLLAVIRTLYSRTIKPLPPALRAALVQACFPAVDDWAQLPFLAKDDLAAGVPLLGYLCDRLAVCGPPPVGEEALWCANEKRSWEAMRTPPAPDPSDEDPGAEDEPALPFDEEDLGEPVEVP